MARFLKDYNILRTIEKWIQVIEFNLKTRNQYVIFVPQKCNSHWIEFNFGLFSRLEIE